MSSLKVSELFDESSHLGLKPLFEDADYERIITGDVINRPGLALAGFFDQFASDRVQVFGRGESAYLNSLTSKKLQACGDKFFSFPLPCVIFSHDLEPPQIFLEIAKKNKVPFFSTALTTNKLSAILNDIIVARTAPRTNYHGVLLDVFGVGVLIGGEPGVGKSETALELLERGHRLIADDAVSLYKRGEFAVHGTVSDNIAYHMEIRGLGILNVKDLYGAGSISKDIVVDLIIHLEEWNEDTYYDRIGIEEKTKEVLGVQIPYLLVPVKPGRNIPVLVETAAKNYRLKAMGFHPAREFNHKLIEQMKGDKRRNTEE